MLAFTGPELRIEYNKKENKGLTASEGNKCLLNIRKQGDSEMSRLFSWNKMDIIE